MLAFGVLVPVNWTGGTLENSKDLTFSDIDKLSISNIQPGSERFYLSFPCTWLRSEQHNLDMFNVLKPA